MRSSETIGELAKALALAQGEFQAVPKTSDNPFYRSKYANLPDVVMSASPILSKHGLAITQLPDFDGTHDLLTTRVMHASGEWIEASMRMHMAKNDPQAQGSAITYGRRYAYSGGVGIVTDEDDDGNAASHKATDPSSSRRQQHGTVRRPPSAETGEFASEKQLALLKSLFAEKGFPSDANTRRAYVRNIIGRDFDLPKELTRSEASQVIEVLMAEPAQAAS